MTSRIILLAKQHRTSDMSSPRDWVLSLLMYSEGEMKGAIRLTKTLYLVDRTLDERGGESPFEFEWYNYGPYDERIFDILEELESEGMVTSKTLSGTDDSLHLYQLTEEAWSEAEDAVSSLSKSERQAFQDTLRAWSDASTDTILSYVFDSRSQMAAN